MLTGPFTTAVFWGAASGALVLGIGGRIAMRIYALRDWQEPYFTAAGTLTVVLTAVAAGAATGAWHWTASRLFASRTLLSYLFFWAGLTLLSLRVLSPVSQARLEVFSPLVLVHGVAVSAMVRRAARSDVAGAQYSRAR